MKNIESILRRGTVLLPLLLAGLLVGGCSNDPVAPQDEAPALSGEDVAHQAAYVAMAAAVVSPQTVEFGAKADKDAFTHTFTGDVAGMVNLVFTAGGQPSGTATADHVDLFTDEGAPLVITIGLQGFSGTVLLGFDLDAAIDRNDDPDTAVITGAGTFASGPYAASFTFDSLAVVSGGAYPGSGTMTFTGSGYTATVTYGGGGTALLEMSSRAWEIDLDTGDITELDTMLLPE